MPLLQINNPALRVRGFHSVRLFLVENNCEEYTTRDFAVNSAFNGLFIWDIDEKKFHRVLDNNEFEILNRDRVRVRQEMKKKVESHFGGHPQFVRFYLRLPLEMSHYKFVKYTDWY